MHVLSVSQFHNETIQTLFALATKYKKLDQTTAGRKKLHSLHTGNQLCSLFYEPSTRTRISFEQAALKLGMGVVSTENAAEFSSASKGETLEDTMRVLNGYNFDAVIVRHPETGATDRAAAVSTTPIINAGDGKGEHPTQALLDLYTIYEKHGTLEGLTVVLGGDLKHGRTVRSLVRLLARYKGNRFVFVSTSELQIGVDIKQELAHVGCTYTETEDMKQAFKNADVVYWTRLQKERLETKLTSSKEFILNKQTIAYLPKKAVIMHPLPRVSEIHTEIDSDPRAYYFKQASNGLYVRMALLHTVLSSR
jgi:aspartate carbamoyltransferase catalytic subunit